MAQESPREPNEEEMFRNLAQFQANRKQIMKLNNNILTVRLEQLEVLKQHYQDYWLDLDLKGYEASLDSLVGKAKFTAHQSSWKRLDEMERNLEEKNKELDERIATLELRLNKFRSVEPNLLAEYRKLKDDLECQELLIRMGEDNKTPK